jgi:hypothetical protein
MGLAMNSTAAHTGAVVTVFQKAGGILTKRISLSADGKIISDGSECRMSRGTARRVPVPTATALAGLINAMASHEALALGTLKDDIPDGVRVVTKDQVERKNGAIARTRASIEYRHGTPAWACIDFDTKGMPAAVLNEIEAHGGLWPFVAKVVPGIGEAAWVKRASTSAGLSNSATGAAIVGSDGMHIYVQVADGADIPRFLQNVHERMWLAGAGYHRLGRAGQLLDRSPIDCAVAAPEGLKFEGAPFLETPIVQDTTCRTAMATEGKAIDTATVAPPLSEHERSQVAQLREQSGRALRDEMVALQNRYDNEHATKLAEQGGIPRATARRLISQARSGTIYPHHLLDFDDLGEVPVSEVLTNPARYVGMTLADPLEGAEYGRCKAKVFQREDGRLIIHSFAHGSTVYYLTHDLRAALSLAKSFTSVDDAVEVYAATNFEPDEFELFCKNVSDVTGVTYRAVARRLNDDLRRRQREKQAADRAAAAETDNRPRRERPPNEGALLAEVKFLDEHLSRVSSGQPPMRNADGKLVAVKTRSPFNMHILGEAESTREVTPTPLISALNHTEIEMLIEEHIRYQKITKTAIFDASLPVPFIRGLDDFRPSALPILNAINSAPMISAAGDIIEGDGLDRVTGLFHIIDPSLRSAVPTETPTQEEVTEAVRFLLDEWLVDVAADTTAKLLVIVQAMTLIQRSILPERPAFFIVAGLRGSGKTTLVHMVSTAVFGRPAPATAWSDHDEERKKALFSIHRQGVPLAAWDNIRRGELISCPHIEAALTSAQQTDRVLGVSHMETVSTTTVHIFTGNQIGPKGDMASRSFVIGLDAASPNPEDRSFAHPDPVQWTTGHRGKIMRALYVILVAGIRNSSQEEAKTRFKNWWRLVGQPLEHAATLAGYEFDCGKLIKNSEVADPDVLAIEAILATFIEIWGVRRFTSADIVQQLPGDLHSTSTDPVDRRRRDRLFDAFCDLIGKELTRPTARSIGKLLQRYLVRRPAWLPDGRVANLWRKQDHESNEYWVEVSAPVPSSTDIPDFPGVGEPGGAAEPDKETSESRWRAPTVSEKTRAVFREAVATLGSQSPVGFGTYSVPSAGDPTVKYTVSADAEGKLHCNCKGYAFRGTCRHVRAGQQ